MIWRSQKEADILEQQLQSGRYFNAPSSQTTPTQSLVQLAQALQSIPKKTVPVPHRKRAYALIEHPEHVKTGLKLLRFSSYVGGGTLVLGLILTSVFVTSAHPGNPLYAYRLKGEQIRLHFATDPQSRLDVQLSLVENRIKDTEKALNDTSVDAATKAATLQELTTQTKAAVETAKEVAVAQKSSSPLDKIEKLTQSQVKVLTQSSNSANQKIGSDALAAIEESSKTIAAAKLLVAASQESDVTNLPASTQILKGTIINVSPSQITVDDVSVGITEQTEIKFSKSETKDLKPELKIGQTVSITAVKNGKTFTAQTIIIVPTPGKVKGATDNKKDDIIQTKDAETDQGTEKVQSGFQVENPAPLYPSNP